MIMSVVLWLIFWLIFKEILIKTIEIPWNKSGNTRKILIVQKTDLFTTISLVQELKRPQERRNLLELINSETHPFIKRKNVQEKTKKQMKTPKEQMLIKQELSHKRILSRNKTEPILYFSCSLFNCSQA